MNYAYLRVSTEGQTIENQRFEINRYCEKEGITIDEWVMETVSGTVDIKKRKIGRLLDKTKRGDHIICSEISRLGRSLYMIVTIMETVIKKKVDVYSIKEAFHIKNNVVSRVLAFSFGVCADVEKVLISERTSEALAYRKSQGVVLGRRKGSRLSQESRKLSTKDKRIRKMIDDGLSMREMAKKLRCDRATVGRYIKDYIKTDDNPA